MLKMYLLSSSTKGLWAFGINYLHALLITGFLRDLAGRRENGAKMSAARRSSSRSGRRPADPRRMACVRCRHHLAPSSLSVTMISLPFLAFERSSSSPMGRRSCARRFARLMPCTMALRDAERHRSCRARCVEFDRPPLISRVGALPTAFDVCRTVRYSDRRGWSKVIMRTPISCCCRSRLSRDCARIAASGVVQA